MSGQTLISDITLLNKRLHLNIMATISRKMALQHSLSGPSAGQARPYRNRAGLGKRARWLKSYS